MKKILVFSLLLSTTMISAQKFPTPFEQSMGLETATYQQCIRFYQQITSFSPHLRMLRMDTTDAGYPLHLIVFSADHSFDTATWHHKKKLVILINNGIHPGEPDGIDASMMLMRDLALGKMKAPSNIVLAVIPVYNIGGALNRSGFSRVNQNGPVSYGFRGNAQNLDLNRDFIKSDSREAIAFARIFHFTNPDIFIDNHVSDGADYQYTMTLLTTQHNKLGGPIGDYLHKKFEPSLYQSMASKNMAMTPYVNFEEGNPEKGWSYFYDAPRYSTGYAALFQTIAFMPETHMLKPFADRVKQTYALMQSIIEEAALQASDIKAARAGSIEAVKLQRSFALAFKADTSKFDLIRFNGYETVEKISAVTGMKRIFYDHTKPFSKEVRFYNNAVPDKIVLKPKAYLIPQGWHEVIDLLKANAVQMSPLNHDSDITVEALHIADYKTSPRVYEKHYRHSDVNTSSSIEKIHFRKGDWLIPTGQAADRFLVEALEPTGDDGYFAWNFFDAILQQKEGYSNYRWEDVAAGYIGKHPELKQQLDTQKAADPKLAASANLQLEWVYKHSPWYEPAHLRYPVYRLQ